MLLLDKLRERCGLGLVCSNPPHVYMDIAIQSNVSQYRRNYSPRRSSRIYRE
ncbi:hypothetical protein BvCmsKSP066_01995 [Escherichia coli]|nr:hypothetical protein BvCmsKSP066_01995 [Escherichia coli]GDO06723.1 hypothetical protein BvCmsKSP076_05092 [Escherichia coli]